MLLALQGDQTAYHSFLERTAVELRSFVARTGKLRFASPDKADDLIQEVLLSIHRKRDLYSPRMPILPWIYAIAKYRWIDGLRSEGRVPKTVDWDEEIEASLWNPVEEEPLAAASLAAALLEPLSDRQKQILVMAKSEEVPLAEVARRFGMSLSAVKLTIHRAIRSIRAKNSASIRRGEK
jgi:RNA polymerase sigma-70 factor (ECF subfamily)